MISLNIAEDIVHSNEINKFNDRNQSIGSANTLRRAMTVNKLSEMFECINDMKYYAKTIEKDIPDYLQAVSINNKDQKNIPELETDHIIHLAEQRSNDNRYILLNDLIKHEKECVCNLKQQS